MLAMAVCAKCGFEYPPGSRFCPGCAAPLTAQEGSARQSRRVVTALFGDVVGSTALAERLDPEVFREVMNKFFAAVREIIEHHGGTVAKFIGDAVFCVFGYLLIKLQLPAKYSAHLPLAFALKRDYAEYDASYKVDGGVFTAGRVLHASRAQCRACADRLVRDALRGTQGGDHESADPTVHHSGNG